MKLANCLFLFFLTYTLAAQKAPAVEFGPIHSLKPTSWVEDMHQTEDGSIYTITYEANVVLGSFKTGEHYLLQQFGPDLDLRKEVKWKATHDGKKLEYELFLEFDNELYLFTSFKNKTKNKNYLFYQAINRSNLSQLQDPVKVVDIDLSEKRGKDGKFDYDFSLDRQHLCIFYDIPNKKNQQDRIGFHVYKAGMKESWSKEVDLPFKEKLVEPQDVIVDNNGEVFVLLKIFDAKRTEKRGGDVNYEYGIIACAADGTEEFFKVQLPGKYLNNLQIESNGDQQLMAAGFYGETQSTQANGCFFIRINTNRQEVVSQNYKEFAVDFITQGEKDSRRKRAQEKDKKGKEVQFDDFSIEDLIPRNDGGVVFLAEKQQEMVRYISDGRGNATLDYDFIFNEIIVVNINPDGTIAWAVNIPKRQDLDTRYFGSFSLHEGKTKLSIFFNDHRKNADYRGVGRPKTFRGEKNAHTTLVDIGIDGTLNRQVLFNNKNNEVLITTRQSKHVGKDTHILIGRWKRKMRLARVKF